MKAILALALLSVFVRLSVLQQCRQQFVTVCDDVVPGGAEKGDVGAPGKAGPQGFKGEKGNRGPEGIQGESCLGEFESEIIQKLLELETLIKSPTSCMMSSVNGRQTLRSGEEVFCDAGWRVIQRRFSGNLSFDRNWEQYKRGFSSVSQEFWLGLDAIFNLTRNRQCEIQFDLEAFDGDRAYARYRSFWIDDESDNYRLHISGYSGTAGNGMTGSHNLDNMAFSTKDRDNDNDVRNCGADMGGWWHNSCTRVRVNARWGSSVPHPYNNRWWEWRGNDVALRTILMKIRCN